jgi:MFS transporter, DHA1 family, tetracycline resistance protein
MMNNSIFKTKAILFLITLIDFIGLGITFPLFPPLMLDPTVSILPQAWSHESRLVILGILLSIYPLGQFIGAAILGTLSDFYGRKRLLLFSLFGTVVGFLASAFAVVFGTVTLLLIGRLLAGLFAGNTAIAQSSMADISTDKNKTANFSLLQVALGLAFMSGPFIGGYLSQRTIVNWFNYSTPFFVVAGALLIVLLMTLFSYRETLVTPKSLSISIFSGFTQIKKTIQEKKFRHVLLIWSLFVSAWWLFEAFLPSYLLQHHHMSTAKVGFFVGSMGATYALFQFLVVRPVSRLFKPENLARISMGITAIMIIGFYLAQNVWQLHIVATLFVCSMGFSLPGLIVSISNLARKEEQGEVMGVTSSIQALATVVMTLFGGALDAININVTTIAGGILMLVSWVCFLIYFRYHKKVKYPENNLIKSGEVV